MGNRNSRRIGFLSSCVFLLLSCSTVPTFSNVFQEDEEEQAFNGFEVHQLSLGAEGDCSLIKYGSCSILIDCGGNQNSKKRIIDNLNKYVDNDIIDYVIFTHADSDHVACADTALSEWLNEAGKNRQIGMLVDFDISQDPTNNHPLKNAIFEVSGAYGDYKENFRDKNSDKIRHYVTASLLNYQKRGVSKDAVKNALISSNANLSISSIMDEYALSLSPTYASSPSKDVYSSGKGADASIKFLYNYFFDHPVSGKVVGSTPDSADKNIISVCTMFKLKTDGGYKRMLFNGDLEEYDSLKKYTKIASEDGKMGGENTLINQNSEEFGEPITYYKASHHGSNTSNDPAFLETIRPEYIGISAVAGGQHQFPSENKDMADSSSMVEMTRFTDHIYITDKNVNEDGDGVTAEPYYGNIVFKMSKDGNDISFQNPDDFTLKEMPKSLFVEKAWFRKKRKYETDIINLTVDGKTPINVSYIKLGHIDVIVGAGKNPGSTSEPDLSDDQKEALKNKVSQLCNDGVLEYLIIPGKSHYSLGLVEDIIAAKGIKTIGKCIYLDSKQEELMTFLDNDKIKSKEAFESGCDPINLIDGSEDYKLEFYANNSAYLTHSMPTFYTVFKAEKYTYLNAGDNARYDDLESIPNALKNKVNTIQMAKCGEFFELDEKKAGSIGSFKSFYDTYIKAENSNVMMNGTMYLDTKAKLQQFNTNVLINDVEKLSNIDLVVSKILKGDSNSLSPLIVKGLTCCGDTMTRVFIENGQEVVRKAMSRDLECLSISDKECAKRSDVHANTAVIKFETAWEALKQ